MIMMISDAQKQKQQAVKDKQFHSPMCCMASFTENGIFDLLPSITFWGIEITL